MGRYAIGALEAFARDVLLTLDARPADASTFAKGLIVADARGVDSHGIARLPAYVRKVEEGLLDLVAVPTIAADAPSTAIVDANHGMGHVAAEFSMDLAIGKARETGMGYVSTIRSNHFGIAGYYAALALEHGMIGLCATNSGPIVAPTFGRTPMLGTNPIAVAAPTSTPPAFLLDMATSAVSGGKLQIAIRAGAEVPLGWGIDKDGRDSPDPKAILGGGALLPLGSFEHLASHKGYGMAMAVEILAGVLGGGVFGPDVVALTQPQRADHANVSHMFAAIDIGRFMPVSTFERRMDDWIAALKASAKAPGSEEIYVPGEKEWRIETQRRAQGIPVSEPVVASLLELGARRGVRFPDPVAAAG